MITPKFLNKVIEELENSIALLNDDMTKKIAKKMASSFSSNMPKNQKELSKMLNDKNVYDDIQEAITKRKKSIDAEVKKAYLKSACEISNHNTEVAETLIKKEKLDIELPRYARNTVKASEMNLTDKEVLRVEKAYKKAQNVVNNLTGAMPSDGQNAYIDACNKAFLKVQQGQNLDNALTSAIDEMAQLGITHVNYDSGRRERIEVAVARSVRTGINQMNADLVLQRCATMGVSYVQVSQHLGARVTKKEDYTNHSLWQGKVYSIDWNKSVFKEKGLAPEEVDEPRFNWLNKIKEAFTPKKPSYPDFVDKCGYGLLLGICGVNCRHTFRLFIPEVNSEYEPLNDTENELQYEAEQKARAMARAIRETKREINALEYSGLETEKTNIRIKELNNKLNYQIIEYKTHNSMYHIKTEQYRLTVQDFKKYYKNDIIKASELWDSHESIPSKYKPNAIIDHYNSIDGKIDSRRFYDDKGRLYLDINVDDHNKPKYHKYGIYGEHAHTYEWNKDGSLKNREIRELTKKEFMENADILWMFKN